MNPNDRKLVCKQFEKHIIQIFETLGKAVSDKQFDTFMITLSGNIKNLGARIKQIDKKIEKKIRDVANKGLLEQVS